MSIEHVLELLGALVGWIVLAELRIRKTKSQLAVSQEQNEDAKIDNKVHALSDAELDSVIARDLGGRKPPT